MANPLSSLASSISSVFGGGASSSSPRKSLKSRVKASITTLRKQGKVVLSKSALTKLKTAARRKKKVVVVAAPPRRFR